MAFFFDDDTKAMIEDSEFSESVVVEYPTENVTTSGLFDEVFLKVDPNTGAEVMVDKPRITLYYNDLKETYGEIINSMYVQARGKRFRIVEPQPDGSGIIYLVLKDA